MIDSGNAEPSCPATRAPQLFTCSAPCEFLARSVARPRPRSTWHRSFEIKFFQALTRWSHDLCQLWRRRIWRGIRSTQLKSFVGSLCDCSCSVMLQFGRSTTFYVIPSYTKLYQVIPSYTNVAGFGTLNSPILSALSIPGPGCWLP